MHLFFDFPHRIHLFKFMPWNFKDMHISVDGIFCGKLLAKKMCNFVITQIGRYVFTYIYVPTLSGKTYFSSFPYFWQINFLKNTMYITISGKMKTNKLIFCLTFLIALLFKFAFTLSLSSGFCLSCRQESRFRHY